MIYLDRATNSLNCAGCNKDPLELRRETISDQERFIHLQEAFKKQHSDCALLMKFKGLFESEVAHV